MSRKLVEAANGKLVYWILTLVVATAGFLAKDTLTDIKTDVREIRKVTDGFDVLEERVERLEDFHGIGGE